MVLCFNGDFSSLPQSCCKLLYSSVFVCVLCVCASAIANNANALWKRMREELIAMQNNMHVEEERKRERIGHKNGCVRPASEQARKRWREIVHKKRKTFLCICTHTEIFATHQMINSVKLRCKKQQQANNQTQHTKIWKNNTFFDFEWENHEQWPVIWNFLLSIAHFFIFFRKMKFELVAHRTDTECRPERFLSITPHNKIKR